MRAAEHGVNHHVELSRNIATPGILKAAVITATIAGLAFVSLFILVSGDTVEERHTSIVAAREAHVFERGWLPDVLPQSTTRLRVTSHPDSNTADGEFYFDPVEWNFLSHRLSVGITKAAPFARWSSDVESHERNGYSAWSVARDEMNWVFFCKPAAGHCEYVAWPKRDG